MQNETYKAILAEFYQSYSPEENCKATNRWF